MFRFFSLSMQFLAVVLILKLLLTQNSLVEIQNGLESGLTNLSYRIELEGLKSLEVNIKQQLPSLNEYQQSYVNAIVTQKNEVKRFYYAYCQGSDANPIIYGANLEVMCGEITKANILVS